MDLKSCDQSRVVRGPNERVRTPYYHVGESMTEQSHAEDCDVNSIIKRYSRSGSLPPPGSPPIFEDVSELNRPYSELLRESEATVEAFEAFSASEAAAAAAAAPTPPPAAPPAPSPS